MTRPTRALNCIFIFSAVFCLEYPVIAAPSLSETSEAVLVSKAMVDWLRAGDFKRVMEEFTVEAKERLPQESLEAAWRSLNDRLGGFKAISRVSRVPADEGNQVVLVCEFTKAAVDMKVTFDWKQRVSNLQFALSSEEPAKVEAVGKQVEQPETPISTKQWAIHESDRTPH